MDHRSIIKAVGGAKALSDALALRGVAVAPVTVRSWTLSGRMIPAKYWAHVADVAHVLGVEVSFAALADAAAASGSFAQAARA